MRVMGICCMQLCIYPGLVLLVEHTSECVCACCVAVPIPGSPN